jgi:hypothetical protein
MKTLQLTTIVLLIGFQTLDAQMKISVYTDLGHTNVSEKLYFKSILIADYQLNDYKIRSSFQSDILSPRPQFLSGWNVNFSRNFRLKRKDFVAKTIVIYTPFSELLKEINWGISLETDIKKFKIKLGTGFRTLAYTKQAIQQYGFTQNTEIHENFNLLYNFGYNFSKHGSVWNIELNITDIDHFLIHQETNPMINICFDYRINNSIEAFTEFWYKSSGMMNMHVNYFGTLLRTGIIYKL